MPTYDVQDLIYLAAGNEVIRSKGPELESSRYGRTERLVDHQNGTRVAVKFKEDSINYIIPDGCSWTAGPGRLRIDRALRIVDEGKETSHLREVIDSDELSNVAAAYLIDIQRRLEQINRSREQN